MHRRKCNARSGGSRPGAKLHYEPCTLFERSCQYGNTTARPMAGKGQRELMHLCPAAAPRAVSSRRYRAGAGKRRRGSAPCHKEGQRAKDEDDNRADPQENRVGGERRPQQHELAIAADDEVMHARIGIASHEALAHEEPQVAGKRRVAIIDRLVLADEATQAGGDVACALLEPLVGQHFVGLHRKGTRRETQKAQQGREGRARYSAGAGCAAAQTWRGPVRRP